jgi:hypothetical protein
LLKVALNTIKINQIKSRSTWKVSYLIFCFTDTNYSNKVYMLYLQIITGILKDILIMRRAFEKSVHGCTSYTLFLKFNRLFSFKDNMS